MNGSEPILLEYIRTQGIEPKYEETVGSANPDFSVWTPEGEPVACWEMADRALSQADVDEIERVNRLLREGADHVSRETRTDSLGYVQFKIAKKSKQLSKVGDVPAMLVLADWAHNVHLGAEMIVSAMYGWPCMTIYFNAPDRPSEVGRGDGGRMNSSTYVETNNSISAIGVLRHENISYHRSGHRAFCERAIDRYGSTEHTWHLCKEHETELRSSGIDLDRELPVLDIVLNVHAHTPWPMDLIGPYDRVYSYNPATQAGILVHDGLAPESVPEVPASRDQLDYEAILNDPLLRND